MSDSKSTKLMLLALKMVLLVRHQSAFTLAITCYNYTLVNDIKLIIIPFFYPENSIFNFMHV